MFAIFKKELRSYFINAIGYVYAGVFLAVSAMLLCMTTLSSSSYDTSNYFNFLIFLWAWGEKHHFFGNMEKHCG